MTKEIEQHLSTSYYMSKKQIMVNNFLGGLSWGFGTVVGATIVVAFLIWLLSFFIFIPGINDIIKQAQPVNRVNPLQK